MVDVATESATCKHPLVAVWVDAILDTNVVLDIQSIHDMTAAYERLGTADLDAPHLVYRRARARESLLLGMYLHTAKATTLSLHSEFIALLTRVAPPTAKGGVSLGVEFTTTFSWFVKDYLLPDWNMNIPTEPGGERGNAADAALVALARQASVPLITNEGYTAAGIVDEKLRKRAKEAGVEVFAPREFYDGKMDETAETEAFLERWASEAPRYLEQHRNEFGRDKSDELLAIICGLYRHVLLGETEGGAERVRVRL